VTIKLPNWPPERLVREAVLAWNLRHPGKEFSATSPWPDLCAAVHRFLRHQHSVYDQTLDALAGYDAEVRDELAEAIYQLARAQYPWLRSETDPRPFPKALAVPDLLFDKRSYALSEVHTRISHLESALRDLQHKTGVWDQVHQLRAELSELRQIAREEFKALTQTVPQSYAHSTTYVRRKERAYYYGGLALPESYTCYAGFRCSACDMAVMQTKRAVPVGQGRRWLVFSCGCTSYAVAPAPAGYRLEPVTAAFWAQLRLEHEQDAESGLA